MRIRIPVFVCSIALCGCGHATPQSVDSSKPQPGARDELARSPAKLAPTAPDDSEVPLGSGKPVYGWYETTGAGEMALLTHLSIPGLFADKTDEMHLGRDVCEDADGRLNPPPDDAFWGGRMVCADGKNVKGGFGYDGSIGLMQMEGGFDTVVLKVLYGWTTPDQVRGNLDKKLALTVGRPANFDLGGGCRLRVEWPTPSARKP